MASPESQLEQQVTNILEVEAALIAMESQLAPELRAFLIKQKETQQQITDFWKVVEQKMIDNDIKSIKGDWGSITIAERIGWDHDATLPPKFFKKVPDLKRMTDTFRLEGKPPKGATPKYTKYLTKRIKGREIE